MVRRTRRDLQSRRRSDLDTAKPGANLVTFDLAQVPFSCYGSYLAVSRLEPENEEAGLYLRSVHPPNVPLLRLEPGGDSEISFREHPTPTALHLETGDGRIDLSFARPDALRVRAVRLDLRLSAPDHGRYFAVPRGDGIWELTYFEGAFEHRIVVRVFQGDLRVDAPWEGLSCDRMTLELQPKPGSDTCEIVIEDVAEWPRLSVEDPSNASFEACQKAVAAEFEAWLSRMPEVEPRFREARELAAYILWSCVVEAQGHLTRDAVYMSKNDMAGIWSWDHCFNALALAPGLPDLAWDQLMIVFDAQLENGRLYDLSTDRHQIWNFCKPPVHGWALQRLARHDGLLDQARLEEIYPRLARWTEWWFSYRDDDGDGIPQYNHGFESGLDNATVFQVRLPIESPDLCAYLVLQLETLATVAGQIGRAEEAEQWSERSELLLEAMLGHFWRDDRFVARHSGSHETIDTGSLLLFLPLVLGTRLPEEVREELIERLTAEGEFLTEHGLATERLTSAHYTSDGYWLGPIWGASTMLLIDGLESAGKQELADDLRRRFCDLVARGVTEYAVVAENYDAITGEPLRDKAFTWTSGIFLVLAHELWLRVRAEPG